LHCRSYNKAFERTFAAFYIDILTVGKRRKSLNAGVIKHNKKMTKAISVKIPIILCFILLYYDEAISFSDGLTLGSEYVLMIPYNRIELSQARRF
jgi:hypothetical protein